MWTHFWDMSSGGSTKLDWDHIYIEAKKSEARKIFEKKFDRDPDNVTCDCCGADYVVEEYEVLEKATEYQRRGMALKEYLKNKNAHFIFQKELLKHD